MNKHVAYGLIGAFLSLTTFLSPWNAPGPNAVAAHDPDADISKYVLPELVHHKLGYELDRVVAAYPESADTIPVTVYVTGSASGVAAYLTSAGANVRRTGDDYVEAYVPIRLLNDLAGRSDVLKVRTIGVGIPEPERTPEVYQWDPDPNREDDVDKYHGWRAWNEAGVTGQGMRIGVIEVGFPDISSRLGNGLPDSIEYLCFTDVGRSAATLSGCENGGVGNGTNIVQTLAGMAPDASFYVGTFASRGDLGAVADWMVSEGVSVIVHPNSWGYDAPPAGTSSYGDSPQQPIQRAVAAGVVWISAAGDAHGSTWAGRTYFYGEGPVEIASFRGYDHNWFVAEEGATVDILLRWEDEWGAAKKDLNLVVLNGFGTEIVAASGDLQSGMAGDDPYEAVRFVSPGLASYEIVLTRDPDESVPHWIQLQVAGARDGLGINTDNGSITTPGDNNIPGMITVGAGYLGSDFTTTYQGVTGLSGRAWRYDNSYTSPDVTGVSCSYRGRHNFCGTKEASTHVAGVVLLTRQRFPDLSPTRVHWHVQERAQERSYDDYLAAGYGLARLLRPQPPPPPAVWVDRLPDLSPTRVHWHVQERAQERSYDDYLAAGYGLARLLRPQPPPPPAVWVDRLPEIDRVRLGATDFGNPPGSYFYEPADTYDLRYRAEGETEWTYVNDFAENPGPLRIDVAWLTGLRSGTTYNVQSRGHNVWGTSAWSDGIWLDTPELNSVPSAPQNLTATANGQTQIDLSWSAPSGGVSSITGYRIEVSTDRTAWMDLVVNTGSINTSYFHTGLTAGSTRHYRVSAIDSEGTGRPSNVVSATTTTVPADPCVEVESLGALTAPATRTGAWADDCDSETRNGSYARYYSFSLAQAGQVEINLTSAANTYLALRRGEGRTGTLVTSNDDVSSRYTHSSINRMLDAGTYTVEATTIYPRTRDFTLSFRPLACTENLGMLAGSVDRSNSLWVDTCASTQREGSYARSYTFTLPEETYVGINLTSAQNTYLYLAGTTTNGAPVDMENDDAPGQRTRNSGIEGDFEAGTYTIEATTHFRARLGTFHLNIGYFGSSR